VLSYDAIADGVPAGHAVRRVLQTIPLPQVAPRQRANGPGGDTRPPGTQQPLVYGQAAPQQTNPWGERSA
jgi:MoxR-like ATPase